mgnify:CR=1 FL=1
MLKILGSYRIPIQSYEELNLPKRFVVSIFLIAHIYQIVPYLTTKILAQTQIT